MKLYVALGIFSELMRKDRVKASYLATKYEVSTRTIYRYLDILESAGIKTVTYSGYNGGLSIDKSYSVNFDILSQKEKDYLMYHIEDDSISKSIRQKLKL